MKLYGRLRALASDVGGWGADFPPTEQQLQVHDVLNKRLSDTRKRYKVLMESQIPAFHKMLEEEHLTGPVIRP